MHKNTPLLCKYPPSGFEPRVDSAIVSYGQMVLLKKGNFFGVNRLIIFYSNEISSIRIVFCIP